MNKMIFFPEYGLFLTDELYLDTEKKSNVKLEESHLLVNREYLRYDENILTFEEEFPKIEITITNGVINIIKPEGYFTTVKNRRMHLTKYKESQSIGLFCNSDDAICQSNTLNIVIDDRNFFSKFKNHIVSSFIQYMDDNLIQYAIFTEKAELIKKTTFSIDGIVFLNPNLFLLKNWNFVMEINGVVCSSNIQKILNYNINPVNDNFTEALKKCGNVDIMEELKRGLMNPHFIDLNGNTSLILALKYELYNTALLLIHSNINLDNMNNENETALNICLKNKNEKLALELIKRNVILDDEINICIQHGLIKTLEILIKKIDNIEIYLEYALQSNNTKISNCILRESYRRDELYESVRNDEDLFYDSQDELFLSIACKFGLTEYAKLMISKFDKITDKTSLPYACINNMEDVALILIDKGADVESEFEGRKLEHYIESEKIMFKILEIRTSILFSDDFRIFRPDELTIVQNIGQGSYGKTKYASHNSNGNHYILKQSISCSVGKIISADMIKEIQMLRNVNRHFPETCPKLYGIMCMDEEECIVLVMENCGIMLETYVNELSSQDRKLKLKDIFHQIIKHVYNLSLLGIIHHDCHMSNVLIKNGKIKLIDLGIVFYYEIFPLKSNVPELYDLHWIQPSGEQNYTFDVFSVGVLICNIIFETIHKSYILDTNDNIVWRDNKHFHSSKLTDPVLKELIKNMIHYDPNLRYTAQQVLTHRYFSEDIIVRNNSLGKIIFNTDYGKYFLNKYMLPGKIDFNHAKKIHTIYSQDSVKLFNTFDKQYIFSCLKLLEYDYISDNSVFNIIFSLFEHNTNKNINTAIISYTYIYTSIYERMPIHFEGTSVHGVNFEIKTNDIRLKPVTVHIFYILLYMLFNGYDNDECDEAIDYIYKTFVSFLCNVDIDFNIWNVISVIAKNRIKDIDDYNLENINEIEKFL